MKRRINTLIFIAIFLFLLSCSMAYSALSSNLTISGDLSYRIQKDIRVTNVTFDSVENNGINISSPTFASQKFSGTINLPNLDSGVIYNVYITNYSNKSKMINSFTLGNPSTGIDLLDYNLTDRIPANETTVIKIKVRHNPNYSVTSNNLSFSVNFMFATYEEDCLRINSKTISGYTTYSITMGNVSTTIFSYNYLYGPILSDSIEKIEFTTTNIPDPNAIGSWDVSNKQNGSVMAWYFDSDNDGLYEVVIGQNGDFVRANKTSSYLFSELINLESIVNLNLLNTANVTDMSQMFNDCPNLTSLNLSSFNTSSVTTMSYMFHFCYNLTSLNLSSFNTSSVTNMSYMFDYCYNLTSLYLSNFNTSSVRYMNLMFYRCNSLTTLNLSNFNTPSVTNLQYMFSGCSNITSLDLSSFNTSSVTNMSYMFDGCSSLTTLNLSSFNTSSVITMCRMFSGCSSLTTLNLSNFNTSLVTTMLQMFSRCSSLTTLDLSSFNTVKVTDMSYMFNGCSGLTSLNVNNFNTSSVTNMEQMFNGCSGLTSLNVNNFNTSSVTNMQKMFSGCSSLTSLSVSSFNTAIVTNMYEMFRDCSKLTSLNLSNFNTVSVTNMSYMFTYCESLVTIYVSNTFLTTSVTSSTDMFWLCNSLVGGNGTTYSYSNSGVTYARPDGYSYDTNTSTWVNDGSPGYFTLVT